MVCVTPSPRLQLQKYAETISYAFDMVKNNLSEYML